MDTTAAKATQRHRAVSPGRGLPSREGVSEHPTALQSRAARGAVAMEYAKHGFPGGGARPRRAAVNECTVSSLLESGCGVWNASRGRGWRWVSNRKFWTVYAYITFLSHPGEWSTTTTSLCWDIRGVVGGGARPGHRLLRIQTSVSPRKKGLRHPKSRFFEISSQPLFRF